MTPIPQKIPHATCIISLIRWTSLAYLADDGARMRMLFRHTHSRRINGVVIAYIAFRSLCTASPSKKKIILKYTTIGTLPFISKIVLPSKIIRSEPNVASRRKIVAKMKKTRIYGIEMCHYRLKLAVLLPRDAMHKRGHYVVMRCPSVCHVRGFSLKE